MGSKKYSSMHQGVLLQGTMPTDAASAQFWASVAVFEESGHPPEIGKRTQTFNLLLTKLKQEATGAGCVS
jgi:hypothetical protein